MHHLWLEDGGSQVTRNAGSLYVQAESCPQLTASQKQELQSNNSANNPNVVGNVFLPRAQHLDISLVKLKPENPSKQTRTSTELWMINGTTLSY